MWKRKRTPVTIRWVAGVMLCSINLGNVATAEAVAAPVQKRFTIAKEGRVILVPLRVSNREIQCIVDTGASRSAFDISLKHVLGTPRGARTLTTPAGPARMETFDWPEANLGGEVLKTDRPVVCLDLTNIRQATNAKIYGVIGIDVLRDRRVQIDFDRGELRFLDELPKRSETLGERIPLELAPDGPAFLLGSISNGKSERFLIDTGTQGQSLAADVFDALREQKLIRVGGSFTSVTAGGNVHGERGQVDSFTTGPFTHQGLRFSRINVSSLGLRYFSRFRVTFDFPGRCVYLQPGPHYLRSEPRATSGVALTWHAGDIVVLSVTKGGAGEAAGLRTDDVLVEINGENAAAFDPFSLRQLLTSDGERKVPLKIRREDGLLDIDLVLQKE